jgi:SAM-dependent methyltransferase
MGCGYGRVLRVLKVAYPDAGFTACDLDRNAVDFCAEVFGAGRVYSSVHPEEVRFDDRFDLVWCGSLFTHLSEERFEGFLDVLSDSLLPGGLLLFTTHRSSDPNLLAALGGLTPEQAERMARDYRHGGFGYAEYERERGVGLAVASPEWVSAQVEKRRHLRLAALLRAAWKAPVPLQDVVGCVRVTDD